MGKERTKTVLTWLVASAWSANLLASMFIKSYEPDDSINAVFMVVVTAIFVAGSSQISKKHDDDPPKKTEEKELKP